MKRRLPELRTLEETLNGGAAAVLLASEMLKSAVPTIADIDHFECNEAFSVVAVAFHLHTLIACRQRSLPKHLLSKKREGRREADEASTIFFPDSHILVQIVCKVHEAVMTADSNEKEFNDDRPIAVVPPRDGVKIYTTWSDMIKHWPKTTVCIVSNEFCERFCYYGMKTVLTFYILNVLKFSEDSSTIFFNCFTIMCYITPILGSIIADGYIGKFWTIFFVSIIYAIGEVMLTAASTQDWSASLHPWLDMAALVVIAFGTGGIKPCVTAFGADQFDQGQEKMLSIYFPMFYFSINVGLMFSAFITPIFRAMPCLGQDSCYPLSFGFPAALMVIATIIFMIGSPWYRKTRPTENVYGEISRLIGGALSNKFSKRNAGPTKHWLEHYLDTHNCENDAKCMALKGIKKRNQHLCQKKQYVDDVIGLFKIAIMFLPVPFFWSLDDQQGSIWLLQGLQMDCNVLGVLILPDQMQSLNAILILVYIPIFQIIIYPLCSKFFTITPLRKLIGGGCLASIAYLVAGFVQLQVNTTLPQLPSTGQSFASFMNTYDVDCNISVWRIDDAQLPIGEIVNLPANTAMVDIPDAGESTFHVSSGMNTFRVAYEGSRCDGRQTDDVAVDLKDAQVYYIAVGQAGTVYGPTATSKPTLGTGEFSMGLTLFTDDDYSGNLCVCRQNTDDFDEKNPCNPRSPADFYYWETNYNGGNDDRENYIPVVNQPKAGPDRSVTTYKFKPVKPGQWGLYFLRNTVKDIDAATPPKEDVNVSYSGVAFEINGQGGVYNFVITGTGDDGEHPGQNSATVYQVVQDNQVSIMWQVPQYAIITAGEILFAITGFEFAYSQAAPSMKVLVQAMWLFTTAVGDSIIVIITAADIFDDLATQFFAFSGMMFVVICIYTLLAVFYFEYRYYTKPDEEDDEEEEEEAIEDQASDSHRYTAAL